MPLRLDWAQASIVAAIYEQNRNPKRKRRGYQPKDFLPKWSIEGEKEQSESEQVGVFKRMAAFFGAGG